MVQIMVPSWVLFVFRGSKTRPIVLITTHMHPKKLSADKAPRVSPPRRSANLRATISRPASPTKSNPLTLSGGHGIA